MPKKTISATVEIELVDWISSEIEEKKKYRNRSHLIETALELLKEKEEQDGK